MYIDCRALQPSNAQFPIAVTESGMTIDSSALQHHNSAIPIVVTESGMSIDCRALQPLNAQLPIFVTELGMTNIVSCFPSGYLIIVCFCLSYRIPASEL